MKRLKGGFKDGRCKVDLRVDWDIPYRLYVPKVITLASGDKLVIREAKREEVPIILDVIRPLLTVERDYYDVVSAGIR